MDGMNKVVEGRSRQMPLQWLFEVWSKYQISPFHLQVWLKFVVYGFPGLEGILDFHQFFFHQIHLGLNSPRCCKVGVPRRCKLRANCCRTGKGGGFGEMIGITWNQTIKKWCWKRWTCTCLRATFCRMKNLLKDLQIFVWLGAWFCVCHFLHLQ